MQSSSITVGPATVTALFAAAGPFFMDRRDAFPEATDEHWKKTDRLDPGAVDEEGSWHVQFRCFAIRSPETGTILVDTGVGPIDLLTASWAPTPGELPDSLAATGIDPSDVDTVVLTHSHVDHIGWAVVGSDLGIRPYFPNARYLLQAAEARWLCSANPILKRTLMSPLEESGQLSLLDGEERLSSLVKVIPTPGHTPGHQSVLVEAGDGLAVVTGDVLVHSVQLVAPEVAYVFESDPNQARSTRQYILTLARNRGGHLATAHLTEPIVALSP